MINKIIDISVPIKKGMPVWPKSMKPNLRRVPKTGPYTETEVHMNLHTGTHIDAPLHRIKGGRSIDRLSLEIMSGPAFVAFLPKVKIITQKELDSLRLPKGISRLLFKTANSSLWPKDFQKRFTALNSGAAQWLVKRGIKLVGIDYLSVGPYGNSAEVHEILLKENIVLLEGLDLSGAKPGFYQLVCLPLKLIGVEASPVRAVLIDKHDKK